MPRNQGHLQGFVELAHGSVTGYGGVPADSEQALMLAVAQQHDQLGDNSLPCEKAFAFQHSRWAKGDEVSLAKYRGPRVVFCRSGQDA